MLPILNQLKAEIVLEGTGILEKIASLRSSFTYKTGATEVSYEDYYNSLFNDANSIEHIQLETSVPPGTAQKYLIDLTQGLQLVTDKIEATHTKSLFFLGKLNSAIHNRDNLLATFSVWYQVGVSDTLKALEIKIPASTIKALAESEFNRVLNEDSALDGMKEAVTVLIDHLKNSKKLAMEKYKIGTDQANASILRLPNQGFVDGGEPFPLLKQKYGLSDISAKADRPKYDDEEEEEPLSGSDNPEYVEHRVTPLKSLEAVIKHPDMGVVDLSSEVDLEAVKENWRNSLPVEIDSPSPSLESIEDVEDPFLGSITISKDTDGKTSIKDSTGKQLTRYDDEEEEPTETPKKSKPKYDDDEEDEEPIIETKPQKTTSRERKKIDFDDPF